MSTFLVYIFSTFLAFSLTFWCVLPYLCQDWVYSVYFKGDPQSQDYVKRALKLNDRRIYWAQEHFNELKEEQVQHPVELPNLRKDGDVELVVIVMGMNRKMKDYVPGYLLQTVAEVHKRFAEDLAFPNKKLFICNVDENPDEVADLEHMYELIPMVSRFGGDYPGEKTSKKIFDKSKDDYAFCLSRGMDFKPKYILLLEDDVIPKQDFFNEIHKVIYTDIPLIREGDRDGRDWAYVKLYYPEKWSGYGREYRHVIELIGIGLCGGCVGVILYLIIEICISCFCSRIICRNKSRYPKLQMWKIRFWFVVAGIYCVLICVLIGRPYVVQFLDFRTHVIPAKDCCTQAVLYPGHLVSELSEHLRSQRGKQDFAHDLIMDRWADEKGYVRLLAQPNLVQHIGLVSTVRAWAKKAAYFIY